MTREERINTALVYDLGGFARHLVHEIYDDFASRTCENCKWYKDTDKTFKVCKLYDIAHGKDFGCNRWEAKTVSTDT